jgi:glycosyltransferase involved in cell wall biosynthesis
MVGNAGPGNSISAGARVLRSALREWGYGSQIYAETVAPASTWGDILAYRRYTPKPSDLLILHYTLASPQTEFIKSLDVPLVLIYHNVTPPHFLVGANQQVASRAATGRNQLPSLRKQTILALGVSEFNRRDLVAAGYTRTGVVPVLIPEDLLRTPADPEVMERLKDSVNLLCVGRVAPNKRLEDVIKVLYYYRQIEPSARLFLAGHTEYYAPYVRWLRGLVSWLDLENAVTFTGHVSDAALAAYYRRTDVFVYMSEHEGFGIPLVESMRFGVPVIAFASTAVPETLGGAGILVTRKHFPVVAEIIHLLQSDADLREKVIARQTIRAQELAPDRTLEQIRSHLDVVIDELQ